MLISATLRRQKLFNGSVSMGSTSSMTAMLAAFAWATLPVGALATPSPPYPHKGPLACQANEKFPMLPTFHIIGNVTQATDGSITLEPINDCSGVT